jgi:hypothetical protein
MKQLTYNCVPFHLSALHDSDCPGTFLSFDSPQQYLKHQYNETNVMHCLFSLLRIMGLYMFQALLAHPQVVLNKQHLVHVM